MQLRLEYLEATVRVNRGLSLANSSSHKKSLLIMLVTLSIIGTPMIGFENSDIGMEVA